MASRVLVVGSGVIGLRTAVELTRKNVSVVLRSPRNPLDVSVCSQGAGGLWMPFHCDDPRTDRWSIETLDELHPMGVDPHNPLVEIVPTISLYRKHIGPTTDDFLADNYKLGTGGKSPLPAWTTDPRLEYQHLTIEMLWWQNIVYKLKIPSEKELFDAGYRHASLFNPPIIDTPLMLEDMLKEIDSESSNDVNVETGHFYESLDEMLDDAKSLDCHAVVNCTGLGASKICNDNQLIGGRGILHHYDRDRCIRRESKDEEGQQTPPLLHDANILTEDAPWGSEDEPCYMIVRGDTIVVGGSYLEGDTETGIRPKEHQRLLENARFVGIDTDKSKPKGQWTGFRPYRPTSRCEIDQAYSSKSGIQLVHSYGYGGSGWTVYVGCAKEATRMLGF